MIIERRNRTPEESQVFLERLKNVHEASGIGALDEKSLGDSLDVLVSAIVERCVLLGIPLSFLIGAVADIYTDAIKHVAEGGKMTISGIVAGDVPDASKS